MSTINKPLDWTPMEPLKVGDTFTMAGQYKRRSFWQWLKNEQRILQQFTVIATNESYSQYEASNG